MVKLRNQSQQQSIREKKKLDRRPVLMPHPSKFIFIHAKTNVASPFSFSIYKITTNHFLQLAKQNKFKLKKNHNTIIQVS